VNKQGFTLLEIMLVAIILGVLITLSVPNFKNTYSTLEFDNTTKNIFQLMKYAQEKAILQKCYYKFVFSERKYWIEKGISLEKFHRPSDKTGKIQIIPDKININPDDFSLIFAPDGNIEEQEIIISKDNELKYKITTKEPIGHLTCIQEK